MLLLLLVEAPAPAERLDPGARADQAERQVAALADAARSVFARLSHQGKRGRSSASPGNVRWQYAIPFGAWWSALRA